MEFNLFPEFLLHHLPPTREVVRAHMAYLIERFQTLVGNVHLDYGFKIVMDRPGVDRHYKSSQLASLPSGVDPVNSCKGPANIFMLVECIWEDQPGLGEVPRRTAWVIVQFSRARRCAIIWDLAPSLNMRRKVASGLLTRKLLFQAIAFNIGLVLLPRFLLPNGGRPRLAN